MGGRFADDFAARTESPTFPAQSTIFSEKPLQPLRRSKPPSMPPRTHNMGPAQLTREVIALKDQVSN